MIETNTPGICSLDKQRACTPAAALPSPLLLLDVRHFFAGGGCKGPAGRAGVHSGRAQSILPRLALVHPACPGSITRSWLRLRLQGVLVIAVVAAAVVVGVAVWSAQSPSTPLLRARILPVRSAVWLVSPLLWRLHRLLCWIIDIFCSTLSLLLIALSARATLAPGAWEMACGRGKL